MSKKVSKDTVILTFALIDALAKTIKIAEVVAQDGDATEIFEEAMKESVAEQLPAPTDRSPAYMRKARADFGLAILPVIAAKQRWLEDHPTPESGDPKQN